MSSKPTLGWRVIEKIDGLVLLGSYHDMVLAQMTYDGEFKVIFPLDEPETELASQRLTAALGQWRLQILERQMCRELGKGADHPKTHISHYVHPDTVREWLAALKKIVRGL